MARNRRQPQRFERRLLSTVVLGLACVTLVGARLFQVQWLDADKHEAQARKQTERTLPIAATRGAILDRGGSPLAHSVAADRRGRFDSQRFYPEGRLAAQLIGTTSTDGTGLEGLELFFNKMLCGRDGSRVVGADARGQRYSIPGGQIRQPEDGVTLVLTIDRRVQSVLERELKRTVERTRAMAATGVILDPRTGDVLAMASYPTYDPADPRSSTADRRRNRSITDWNEPGSTFKVVMAAACLEEGLVRLDTRVDGGRTLELSGGALLRNPREGGDNGDHGSVTLEETLVESVNTSTARFARVVGKERLFHYARAFGFGCVTGIDLPGEASGILRRPVHWSGRSLETISIGQEVAVTPLQLVAAYSAIANDGLLLKPRIVAEIRDASGRTLRKPPVQPVRRVVSERTARTLRRMLERVVEEGTGDTARVPGVSIAGKTGTAERIDPNTRSYESGRHVASFVGMMPADEPEIVAAIVVDRPLGAGWGSQVAAPCFRRVVEGLLLTRDEPLPMIASALGAD